VLNDLAKCEIEGGVKCLANARDIGSVAARFGVKGKLCSQPRLGRKQSRTRTRDSIMKDPPHGVKAIYCDALGEPSPRLRCAFEHFFAERQTGSLDHVMIIVPEPDHRPRQVVLIAERAQARRVQ